MGKQVEEEPQGFCALQQEREGGQQGRSAPGVGRLEALLWCYTTPPCVPPSLPTAPPSAGGRA